MADSVMDLLFHCGHRHLTRPFTPVGEDCVPSGATYVVCLDCAKQFAYDLKKMRIGKPIDRTHNACVVPGNVAKARKTKLVAYALGATVPVAVLIGAVLKAKKPVVRE